MVHHGADETSPLLEGESRKLVEFSENEEGNPRSWGKWRKLSNVIIIAGMSILSPLASSMFAPGIKQISEALDTSEDAIIACQSGFVIMLGIGPLILAPLSETFGRKKLYLVCFSIFTLLQIPTALAPNIETLITLRTITGFFGSVAVANGGGTISDLYPPSERAGIFGIYLLGVLLGPSIGPLLGGIILSGLNWQWIFWILGIISLVNTLMASFFLQETYVPILLHRKKQELEKEDTENEYYYKGEDSRPLRQKLVRSIQRPMKILFTQPIVITMASYQALIFATTYSLYTQMENIYGEGYGFSTLQVGLLYLFPGAGFLIAVLFLVPRIDTVYNALTKRNNGEPRPEFRLPLANIGSVLLPVSLFWFAWTVQFHVHWAITIISTFFYGIGQVAIFNCVQNYYIDAFEKYAASAIAAGAFFRSLVGGIVPLLTPMLLEKLDVGWGMSVFAFLSLLLAPSPVLFWYVGPYLRERFAIEL